MKQQRSYYVRRSRLTENQQLALVFLGCCISISGVVGWMLHMWLGRGCP